MARRRILTAEALATELAELERQYGLTSAEFYERYQRGELGDDEPLIHWAWLCSLAVRGGRITLPVARG